MCRVHRAGVAVWGFLRACSVTERLLVLLLVDVVVGGWAVGRWPNEGLAIVAMMISVFGLIVTLYFRERSIDRERKQAAFDNDFQNLTGILELRVAYGSPIPVRVLYDNLDQARAAQAFLGQLSNVAVQIACHHIDEATVFLACGGQVIDAVDALKPFIDADARCPFQPAVQLAEAWRAWKSLRTGRRMTFGSDLRRVMPSLDLPKPRPR